MPMDDEAMFLDQSKSSCAQENMLRAEVRSLEIEAGLILRSLQQLGFPFLHSEPQAPRI